MAASNVSAFEVGSFFINQYYQVLSESPEYSHRFYNESSTMTRVDGDVTQTVSTMLEIHTLLTSLNVSKVEVTRLDVQNSWNGGILLIVSGIVRSRNFYGKRKFTQVFFLAPQDNGYFVMNDVLQFQDGDVINQHPVPELPDIPVDSEVHATNSHLEQTVPNYEYEEETREYVNSLHIEDDSPIDKYSLPDEQQHEEFQPETVVEEAPMEEPYTYESAVNHVEDPVLAPAPLPAPEPAHESAVEPAGERAKLSYASILQASKGQSSQSSVPRQTVVRQSMPPPPAMEQTVQAGAQQLNPSASSFVPDASGPGADDGLAQEEELASVYVRNLPSNVTNADLEREFKNFGKIKPNGVFIRNKKEIGICFAFVEYEDMSGVHTAIQASPIELLGRQVYIEGRRASSNSSARGGAVARGRGRGRGTYQNEAPRGRGGVRTSGSAFDSVRGNGFQQRSYQ
ncbi:nuclear transport factor 2-like [Silene latifolia]|uniref:nuclear transport factor 2-like n=1 Tax=Silene latifolia TaxID=37657 RepID=UPI003D76D49C